jgi:enoyl-CoA hydratase/carnithine racemase
MRPVITEQIGDVFVIQMNRPEARNAWNQAMCEGMHLAWKAFDASDARVCVVHATGPCFSAGVDIKNPPETDAGAMPNTSVPCNKPILVATEGACLGMACSFVLMCDIVIAGQSASFAYLEARMGLYGGLMAGFPGRFMFRPGLQWILTGDAMSAQRAHEIGMVNEVVADGTALERAMAIAERIALNAPLVVQSMKAIAMQTLPKGPVEAHFADLQLLDRIARSEDRAEGLQALRDKRPARFKGA